MKTKTKKKYFLISFLFLILVICFNYRFEIIYYGLTTFGYDENKSRRNSFLFSEMPFKNSAVKLRKLLNPQWEEKERLNIALKVKKNFAESNSQKLNFKDGNYFINVFEDLKIGATYQNKKLEYIDIWQDQNKIPLKIWSINMSNNNFLDQSSLEKESKPTQVAPKICGGRLIYARQDGNIGSVDYRTGKRFWHKKYGNVPASSIRGFFCEYDRNLDTYVIILPTGEGVFCLDAVDGSLITSRCGGGKMGVFESRVSPKLVDNIVYVATFYPAGLEAYSFITGKLLWRTDFEIGKFYLGGGSNPWNNFEIDQENQLIFVNTGSPADKFALRVQENYKYSGSLLALDLKKGKIKWQFQEHEKDSWNHDFVGKPILSPTKIKGKDIVITLSKSGSIYFINRKNGLPVFPVEEKTVDFHGAKYNLKRSIYPRPLLDKEYYNYLGKNCSDCDINTTIFGQALPIIKFKRIFDGTLGGPLWGGATIDTLNNYLILSSNHNFVTEHFHDFIPQPLSNLPKNKLINQCTGCHNKDGGINIKERMMVPSLFLTSKIYQPSSLNNYLKNSSFHKKLNFTNQELSDAYKVLGKYDKKLLKNSKYKYYTFRQNSKLDKKRDINSQRLPLGKITAISLDTGKIVWQVPAGTYKLNNSEVIIGSQNFGGIINAGNKDGVSFFTGSFDQSVYAIDNKNGKYLWSSTLPVEGSALPLVHNTSSERWIFIVAGGGKSNKNRSNNLVAFRQNLN